MLLALEIGSGCAWFGEEDPVPPPFQQIALRTQVDMTDDGELEGDMHGNTTVTGAVIGLGAGTVSGGGIGFGSGLIFCSTTAGTGPFAFFLYPICVGLATIAGMVIGGTSGTVMGGSTGLPWKAAGKVNAEIDNLQSERNFTREFADAVTAAVPAKKQVSEDQAEAIVTARLDDVDLRQHWRQRMSFQMHAEMTQEWDFDQAEPPTKACRYTYTSPTHEVEDWLLEDGRAFDVVFSEGISALAHWMARDLEAFSTRTAQPETAEEPATCFQVPED